jgi:endonuclease/exonuclease/phosphatase family metal-dependent hydrolase
VGFLRVPDERVDYIFFKAHSQHVINNQKSRVVLNKPPFTSDHFGVECVLNLELRHTSSTTPSKKI